MSSAIAGFPRELQAHLTDRLDATYWITFAINFILFFGLFGYLQSVPPKPMSEADLRRYMQALYRVTPSAPQPQTTETLAESGAAMDEPVADDMPDADELRRMTAAAAQERMERISQERAARIQQAQAQAREHAIFAHAAGVGRGNAGARGHAARQLSGGGVRGVSLQNMRGVAANNRQIEAVNTLRAGGALTEGAAGPAGGELDLVEIERILSAAGIELDAPPEVASAKGGVSSRSSEEIRSQVQNNSAAMRNCYINQKRSDPRLTGRVTVQYQIRADGSVGNIRCANQRWSNPGLGKLVENCLRSQISRWHFSPSSETTEASFSLNFI